MTPSKRRRQGRMAFSPDMDPEEVNPYLKKKAWGWQMHAAYWNDGWLEAESAYLENKRFQEEEEALSPNSEVNRHERHT